CAKDSGYPTPFFDYW
nr:immunoglobulin heavy chain junction region [Macaca mulatta]MOV47413.1 immunoglobulin heavy chain junction region [Macaca mulatta]MOV47418.1 immunoglobulin heavy chain junction region [Macaca mulatta]MOV47429.1 immunoglobulin heavy chain junction region [Macaca mulatta]MOV47471.1 immunoglobulin heavy chain junction region [Macaca mulatta]